MTTNAEFEGLEEALRRLQDLDKKASRVENKALIAGAEIVADQMRKNVSVSKNGGNHIKDNIEVTKVKKNKGVKEITIQPNEKVNWRAKFLEYGTSKMPAEQFVEISGIQKAKEVEETMIDVIKSELK
jgi:HK97 gp10 family phage protein